MMEEPETEKRYISPIATAISELLQTTAQKEADAAAASLKKKNANKQAAKYVVKIAASSAAAVSSSADSSLLFQLTAVCNTIARLCCLGIAVQFAEDMIELGSHQWISSIMRRTSTSNATSVQAACCHALANMLLLTKEGTPSRSERQKLFVDANIHVAVCKTLGCETCVVHRDCVVAALKLCSLLSQNNKATAKSLRRVGAVTSIQKILIHHSELESSV